MTRIVALLLIGVHALQVVAYPAGMNLRTSIAILLFAAAAAFADRHAHGRYTLPALRAFGLGGMVLLMGFLQWTVSRPG